jgi:hypothetical protein
MLNDLKRIGNMSSSKKTIRGVENTEVHKMSCRLSPEAVFRERHRSRPNDTGFLAGYLFVVMNHLHLEERLYLWKNAPSIRMKIRSALF